MTSRRSRLRARFSCERGVTLIELMTVIAMLGIVFTATFFFYQAIFNRTGETQERRNTLADQRVALDRIARDIRAADSILAPAAGAVSNGIELRILHGEGDGTTTVAYDCSASGTCTRSVGGASPRVVIEGLTEAAQPVFDVDANLPYVRVTLEALPEGRARPIVLSRGVALRNHCAALPEPEGCA